MSELDRAAEAAVAEAAALGPTPVEEVEARANALRRRRVGLGGAASVLVAFVLAGVTTLLGGDEGGAPLQTAGVGGDATTLAVTFPVDADEARERAVLDARLAALGAPAEVGGEWPSLTVRIDRSVTAADASYALGSAGLLTGVAGGVDDLACPASDAGLEQTVLEHMEALASAVDQKQARLAEIEPEIVAGGVDAESLVLERATLYQEINELNADIREAQVEAAAAGPGARLVDGVAVGSVRGACASHLDAVLGDGDLPVLRVTPAPGAAPVVEVSDVPPPGAGPGDVGEAIVRIDLSATEAGRAAADAPAVARQWLVDGWWLGEAPATSVGEVAIALASEEVPVLRAVLAGGYLHPPVVAEAPTAVGGTDLLPAGTRVRLSGYRGIFFVSCAEPPCDQHDPSEVVVATPAVDAVLERLEQIGVRAEAIVADRDARRGNVEPDDVVVDAFDLTLHDPVRVDQLRFLAGTSRAGFGMGWMPVVSEHPCRPDGDFASASDLSAFPVPHVSNDCPGIPEDNVRDFCFCAPLPNMVETIEVVEQPDRVALRFVLGPLGEQMLESLACPPSECSSSPYLGMSFGHRAIYDERVLDDVVFADGVIEVPFADAGVARVVRALILVGLGQGPQGEPGIEVLPPGAPSIAEISLGGGGD